MSTTDDPIRRGVYGPTPFTRMQWREKSIPMVGFSWSRVSMAEFSVTLPRDTMLDAFIEGVRKRFDGTVEAPGRMVVPATLLPHAIADLLPPGSEFGMMSRNPAAREALLAVGIDMTDGMLVHLASDMIPDPVAVAAGSLLYADHETRVQDRGDLGVSVHFRHEGQPATKWFTGEARDQIARLAGNREVLANFLHRAAGVPLPRGHAWSSTTPSSEIRRSKARVRLEDARAAALAIRRSVLEGLVEMTDEHGETAIRRILLEDSGLADNLLVDQGDMENREASVLDIVVEHLDRLETHEQAKLLEDMLSGYEARLEEISLSAPSP